MLGFPDTVMAITPERSPSGGVSMLSSLNVATRVVPTPSSENMLRCPPLCSALCLNNGIPIPTFLVVRDVTKGSLTCSTISGGIPVPLSLIKMEIRFVSVFSSTPISTNEACALVEFCTISSIWSDRSFMVSQRIGLAGCARPFLFHRKIYFRCKSLNMRIQYHR